MSGGTLRRFSYLVIVVASMFVVLGASTSHARPALDVSQIVDLERQLAEHKAEDKQRLRLLAEYTYQLLTTDLLRAEPYTHQLVELAEKLGDNWGLAEGHRLMGVYYQFQGAYSQDLDHLQRALSYAELTDDYVLRSNIIRNIANHHFNVGSFKTALELFQQALDFALHADDEKAVASVYSSLGTLYLEVGDHAEADGIIRKSIAIFERLDDKIALGVLHINLGANFYEQGDFRQARENYNISARYAEESGDIQSYYYAIANIASLDKELGDLDTAIPVFHKVKKMAADLNDLEMTSYTNLELADSYRMQRRFQEALAHLDMALDIFDKMGVEERKIKVFELRAKIYKDQGLYKEAYEQLREYQATKDRFYPDSLSRNLAEMRASYESRAKEAELERMRQAGELANLQMNAQKLQFRLVSFGWLISFLVLVAAVVGYRMKVSSARSMAEKNRILTSLSEELKRANLVKTEFLANTSHEIRTPMNGILGMARMLKSTKLSATQSSYVDAIDHSGHALLSLINDILDISKIEEGRLEIRNEPFSVRKLVASNTAIWKEMAHEKGLGFDVSIAPDVSDWVVGDSNRVSQILINLVGNAIKFTHSGDVSISITIDSKRPGHIIFMIKDTGIGISHKFREEIFDRFSQETKGLRRAVGGVGLGLAICKKLTSLMGGVVGFDSVQGEGSVFWFSLPLKVAENEPADDESNKRKVPMMSIGSAKILVVEDNPINQKVIEAFLNNMGISIDLASNGREALDILADKAYDVILMDMQMPVMDGVEAFKHLRSHDGLNASTPVVALTANAMQGDREKYIDMGMNDYLAKPIDYDALSAIIHRYTAADEGEAEDS